MLVVTFERAAALLLVITGIQIHIGQCQLVVLSECTCPGRELRLGCTVVGGVTTNWRGTAFDCPGRGNAILLRHIQFSESGLAMEVCNGGNIIGNGRNRTFDGPTDSKFTSELTIHLPLLNTTSNTLEGETVECTRDVVDVIGTHTIAYTRNLSAPPPDNIHLAQVTKNALTFQWDPVQSICSYIQYKVNAEGCGVCPNTTLSESITCAVNDILTIANSNSGCTLSVETMVCGFQSNVSETVTAMLKVPDHPSISKVLPYYNSTSNHLINVDIQVERDSTEDDIISDGISGSVTSYTFNIGFPDSESSCTLPATTLPVSACVDGLCDVTLANLTSLPCSTNFSQVQVAVYASNKLTDGLPSTETLNTSNSLFFVEFEPLIRTFICRFVGQHESKSCEITYGLVDPTDQLCTSQLDNQIPLVNNSDTSDTVNVSIPAQDLLAQTESQRFCFTAIGETPQFTIAVEGMFTVEGTGTSGNTTVTPVTLIVIVAVISFVIIILLVVLIAVLSIIVSKKKNYTLKQRDYTDNDEQQYDRTSFAQRQQRQVPMNHQQQTDEQQYDQTLFHAQQQPHRHNNMVPVHEQQTEEQQYDQIFVQQQSRQPIANQQKPMIYSELGPTATAGKSNIFVPGGDDRIEYAELDHHRRGHIAASDSAKIATSSLTIPDCEPGTFDGREDSPTPPPLPPKYECY